MTADIPAPNTSADPRAVEALLAFWAEAGVDACLGEAPVDRLAAPPPPPPTAAPQRSARPSAPSAAASAPGSPPTYEAALAAARAATDLEALAAAARLAFPGAVLFEGAAPARLMVMGDAPGPEDEAEGAPFRGPRGALVRALLAAAGLAEGVLYANTVFRRTKGGADPTPQAQALAAPFLARAAALARPRAVLLLGGCAVRGTTGDTTPILKLRGAWREWTPEGSGPLPALATLGPDFLLRHPGAKKQAWGDALSLAARLDSPDGHG